MPGEFKGDQYISEYIELFSPLIPSSLRRCLTCYTEHGIIIICHTWQTSLPIIKTRCEWTTRLGKFCWLFPCALNHTRGETAYATLTHSTLATHSSHHRITAEKDITLSLGLLTYNNYCSRILWNLKQGNYSKSYQLLSCHTLWGGGWVLKEHKGWHA